MCCGEQPRLITHRAVDIGFLQDSGGGPDVAVAIHPNYQDRVVLLQQDNRVAIETFEEVRWLWLACVGRYEGALLAQVFACMGWLASHLAAWFRSCQAVQTSLACHLTTGAPRLLPSE